MAFFKGLERKRNQSESEQLKRARTNLRGMNPKKVRRLRRVVKTARTIENVRDKAKTAGGKGLHYGFTGLTGVGASKRATKIRMKKAKARKATLRKQLKKLI